MDELVCAVRVCRMGVYGLDRMCLWRTEHARWAVFHLCVVLGLFPQRCHSSSTHASPRFVFPTLSGGRLRRSSPRNSPICGKPSASGAAGMPPPSLSPQRKDSINSETDHVANDPQFRNTTCHESMRFLSSLQSFTQSRPMLTNISHLKPRLIWELSFFCFSST